MKKILFIVFAVMFSVSVSAHENTKTFQHTFQTSLVQKSTMHSSMYTTNNGGFMQLIYNVFHKVGQVFYTSTVANDSKEETTASPQ